MCSKWLRSKEDISETAQILPSIRMREIGKYSVKGKQYNFLNDCYHTIYKETTPRYVVIENINGKYNVVEMKFHPNCKNGC